MLEEEEEEEEEEEVELPLHVSPLHSPTRQHASCAQVSTVHPPVHASSGLEIREER